MAAKDAHIELSSFLKKMRYSKMAKSGRRNQGVSETDEGLEPPEGQSSGWADILMSKFSTFDPSWPDDVKAKWFDAFKQMMDTIEGT
jgi:hypothetical protein